MLDGVDMEGDNDLIIENGDLVIEYGDIKLTGHPTNLHYTLFWLHIKLLDDFINEDPINFSSKMERFKMIFLKSIMILPLT